MKNLINKCVNLLGFFSIFLILGSILLLLTQVTFAAAFTAQLGVASLAGWSFAKELFYY